MATSNDSTTHVGGYSTTAAANVPPDSGATGKRFQGAAEIRQLKKVLKDTFPSVTAAVTATHTELNLLDGVTATTAELNLLDGVTATTAELNILDGVTSTAAELNQLDGVTVGGTSAGDIATIDGTQTLTNKTLTAPAVSNPTITGKIDEQVYSLAGTALDPANGTIQVVTLSAPETFTDSLVEGTSITLHINGGATHTVTWPTVTWVGGAAPVLTAADVVVLWKVSTTLYASYVGSVA